jgi:hypothetical protein
MDVCLRFSVVCCPVQVEALRRADHPSKESYQLSNRFTSKNPSTMAARCKAHVDTDCLNTRIVGSNPAQCMGVFPYFSVLYCTVQVERPCSRLVPRPWSHDFFLN